jgi:hypothetical protein
MSLLHLLRFATKLLQFASACRDLMQLCSLFAWLCV